MKTYTHSGKQLEGRLSHFKIKKNDNKQNLLQVEAHQATYLEQSCMNRFQRNMDAQQHPVGSYVEVSDKMPAYKDARLATH